MIDSCTWIRPRVRIRVETVLNWTLSKRERAQTFGDLDRFLTQASDGVVEVLRRIRFKVWHGRTAIDVNKLSVPEFLDARVP